MFLWRRQALRLRGGTIHCETCGGKQWRCAMLYRRTQVLRDALWPWPGNQNHGYAVAKKGGVIVPVPKERTLTGNVQMPIGDGRGFCPNCGIECEQNAAGCIACGASFEAGSSWQLSFAAPAVRRPADALLPLPATWNFARKVINRLLLALMLLPLALYLLRLSFSPIYPLPTGVAAVAGLWALFLWIAAGACLWAVHLVVLAGAEFLFRSRR